MEDFQEQEYEFLRRLEEERVDRRTLVKRGLAAGVGLTVLSLSPAALAARKQVLADPPVAGRARQRSSRDRAGGQEGRPPQHDRAAARLGELRRDHDDVHEEVRHRDHERQPRRQLGAGEPGDPLAEGRLARAGRPSTSTPSFAVAGANAGPVREVLPDELHDDPAGDEGHARFLDGRLLGRGLDRLQPEPRHQPAEDVRRTCSSPSTRARSRSTAVRSRRARRSPACSRPRSANGGSLEQRRAGHRLLREAEEGRQLHPGADDARRRWPRARRRSRSTGTTTTSPTSRSSRRRSGGRRSRPTASTAATTAQAVNATAPHPWAARLWQEFLYSDQGQILWLKGYAHPARFNDLRGPEGHPDSADQARSRPAALYAKVEVREHRPADDGEGGHRAAVADEGRGVALATDAAPQDTLRPDAASGRRRLLVRLARRRSRSSRTRSSSCFLPAGAVLVGAFKGNDGGYTLDNVSLALRPPLQRRVRGRASRSASSRRSSAGSLGLLIAYAAIRDGTPRWIRAAFMTFSGVAANFGGIPLAFAFIATLGHARDRHRVPARSSSASTSTAARLLALHEDRCRARLSLLPVPADDPRDRAGDRRAPRASGARRPRTSARAACSSGATSASPC